MSLQYNQKLVQRQAFTSIINQVMIKTKIPYFPIIIIKLSSIISLLTLETISKISIMIQVALIIQVKTIQYKILNKGHQQAFIIHQTS